MTNGVDFKSNIKDFRQDLKDLGRKFGPRGVRFAAAGSARTIRDAAKARAPVDTGLLKKAIYSGRSRRGSNRTKEAFRIAVRGGARAKTTTRKGKKSTVDAYYWHFVEKGYVATGRARNSARRGGRSGAGARLARRRTGRKVPGQWYLRDGFRSSGRAAVRVFERRMTEKIVQFQSEFKSGRRSS